TLLLGMGERNVLLPVLAVIVAVSSVYLTDIKGWLQLNTFVANLAGIIALAVTWREWNEYAAEGQLLSLANLLIYLQFVLLYRKKTVRNYWLLLLLSLLQVAVAAALNMSVSFGVLLPAYMFVGLTTMALFVIHRCLAEHEDDRLDWQRAATPSRSPAEATRRWPFAGLPPAFAAVESPGAAASGMGWSFWRQMIWLGLATCTFALIWFLGLPRPGKKTPWRPSGVVPYSSVGFSETVSLDQLGEVYENPEEVMQVKFFEHGSSKPYRVGGDSALFRGGVLYNYQHGRWHPASSLRRHPEGFRPTPESKLPRGRQLVREEVSLQARSDTVLFTVVPAYEVGVQHLKYVPDSEQLLRPDEPSRKFPYTLVTAAFKDHLPIAAFPAGVQPDKVTLKAALAMPDERDGVDPLAGLRADAAEFGLAVNSNRADDTARALEVYLRDSGVFQYSLRQPRRALGVDPVEAFVMQHHKGHCEYFASALVLMLRSVGIPARLAIGFKGGEYNSVGRYYQVRELHAHAWVEAYVGPQSLPPALADDPVAKANGAWLVLDPTPGRTEEVLSDRYGMGALKRLLDLTQLVWTNYVLGLDSQRQREAIYQPLLDRLEDALQSITDEDARERIRQALSELFVERLGLSHGLFSWQGMTATVVGCLLLVGFWKLAVIVFAFLRRRLVWRHSGRSRPVRHIEFYDRLESLLARHGISRSPGQTQREFALSTGGYLAESPVTQQAVALPRRIVDAFYFVRFGQRHLDNNELRSVEQALSDLAAALDERHARVQGSGFRVQGPR
ncbi:MAG TPA: transglutaminaseTgpA domain-containing protein, partial [Pirellulales bacterium]|nr:transglutaminaseTgpA domain-containing protein [Pirellulales bacterium]